MRNAAYGMASLAVLFAVWLAAAAFMPFSRILLPSPLDVLWEMCTLLATGSIAPDLAMTLFRCMAGLALGVALGVPVGLAMGHFRRVRRSLDFLVDFGRSIPATALIPLFLLFFGVGTASVVSLVTYVTALTMALSAAYGVMNANKLRIMLAKTMGVKDAMLFRKVILPEALPHIASGMYVSISMALVIAVVLEMFTGVETGLGSRIIDAQYVYNTKEMYAVIIMVGIVGYALNKAFTAFERKELHWVGK